MPVGALTGRLDGVPLVGSFGGESADGLLVLRRNDNEIRGPRMTKVLRGEFWKGIAGLHETYRLSCLVLLHCGGGGGRLWWQIAGPSQKSATKRTALLGFRSGAPGSLALHRKTLLKRPSWGDCCPLQIRRTKRSGSLLGASAFLCRKQKKPDACLDGF